MSFPVDKKMFEKENIEPYINEIDEAMDKCGLKGAYKASILSNVSKILNGHKPLMNRTTTFGKAAVENDNGIERLMLNIVVNFLQSTGGMYTIETLKSEYSLNRFEFTPQAEVASMLKIDGAPETICCLELLIRAYFMLLSRDAPKIVQSGQKEVQTDDLVENKQLSSADSGLEKSISLDKVECEINVENANSELRPINSDDLENSTKDIVSPENVKKLKKLPVSLKKPKVAKAMEKSSPSYMRPTKASLAPKKDIKAVLEDQKLDFETSPVSPRKGSEVFKKKQKKRNRNEEVKQPKRNNKMDNDTDILEESTQKALSSSAIPSSSKFDDISALSKLDACNEAIKENSRQSLDLATISLLNIEPKPTFEHRKFRGSLETIQEDVVMELELDQRECPELYITENLLPMKKNFGFFDENGAIVSASGDNLPFFSGQYKDEFLDNENPIFVEDFEGVDLFSLEGVCLVSPLAPEIKENFEIRRDVFEFLNLPDDEHGNIDFKKDSIAYYPDPDEVLTLPSSIAVDGNFPRVSFSKHSFPTLFRYSRQIKRQGLRKDADLN
ncbi:hypothetical protein O9G_001158 [Rozella allomycis CSF55]|uniref:LisH domain-containing protein n=1 Tax=Rozella allomycis (strain CSF55) TaxID=988480 RepID=A0A075AXD5_ROZAC|nr:hypothetical protein O9G_001158 [Rozella allomycis CSF55]|eukprot:EPZ33189.1 hypothetical protein O9G_001158 [Rozella allomycis CSF55]